MMKRTSHGERVNSLFDQILSRVDASMLDAKWVESLRRDAVRGNYGWKRELESYLRGLCCAGVINAVEFDDLCEAGEACSETDVTWLDLLVTLTWTVCVAISAVASLANGTPWWGYTIGLSLSAAMGAFWGHQRLWLPRSGRLGRLRLNRIIAVIFCASLGPVLGYSIPALIAASLQQISISSFKSDRTAFSDDPQGFKMIRDFARVNFGVEVILGDVKDSWSMTALNVPGSSPAAMVVGPGFCQLNIYRANLLQESPQRKDVSDTLWVQGVMVHELAHCLDISRDLVGFDSPVIHGYAIAPSERSSTFDVASYISAAQKPATLLWREGLGDMLAVGFWRLTAPLEATNMTGRLRQKRSQHAGEDRTHATMCWIDDALKSDAPTSTKDLFLWADHLRTVSICTLNGT